VALPDHKTKHLLKEKLIEHKQYIDQFGEDMPEIRNWTWGTGTAGKRA